MANEDGTVEITLNGEIYNYKELRERLEGNGHIFKSKTDTEAVLHLYEEYGPKCVEYLRGMFAFAVWDEKRRSLFLARDRAGKKPVFYYYDRGIFCFASELSAILESGLIKKEINDSAIHYYLTLGYIPAPLTIYKNIVKLPAAHKLILNENGISVKRYWSLDFSKKIDISEKEAAEKTLTLLRDAVKIRMNSDVPLGAFLSGGIDSSVVVALMSQLSEKKIRTFSIGFDEGGFNELKYARLVSERFRTEHTEFMVRPQAQEILPLLVERYGEPYADSSCIPTYYVSRETKKYVTVALNGDGGDELFGGYERYQAMAIAERYQRMPGSLKNIISMLSLMVPDTIDSKSRLRSAKRFLTAINMPAGQRYLRWTGLLNSETKDSVYSEEFKKRTSRSDPLALLSPYFDAAGGLKIIDRAIMADLNLYLPYDLLVKVDIASMANSLEARSPFLDHHLMEFAASLPANYKVKGFVKKYILKKAVKGLIPYKNIHRRKMGFGVPIGGWLRSGLKDLLCETLLSDKALDRGYFKAEIVTRMVKEHTEGRADWADSLWALMMLELWHKRFID
jgi:asparagine synthase (glutamine-hydrolysing)